MRRPDAGVAPGPEAGAPPSAATLAAVRAFVGAALPGKRLRHSESVARLAARLCGHWGLDPLRGELAGLAHDMCRAMADDELLDLARRDGQPVEGLFLERPRLLHARAAAVLLRGRFGVADEGVLEAVGCHTFGAADMGDLAKIVYCADKVEPGRPHIDPAYLETLLRGTIDAMTLRVVEDNLRWLEGAGKVVAEPTMALYRALASGGGGKA